MASFTLTASGDTFPDLSQDISGNDTIFGLAGRDVIYGGDGNETRTLR